MRLVAAVAAPLLFVTHICTLTHSNDSRHTPLPLFTFLLFPFHCCSFKCSRCSAVTACRFERESTAVVEFRVRPFRCQPSHILSLSHSVSTASFHPAFPSPLTMNNPYAKKSKQAISSQLIQRHRSGCYTCCYRLQHALINCTVVSCLSCLTTACCYVYSG